MELMRLGPVGCERPAVKSNGVVYDLSGLTDDIDGIFLATDGMNRVYDAIERRDLAELKGGEGQRVGPPVAQPTAVLCIGQNYAAHAAESGDAPPTAPILFFKHPNTVVGPFDDVLIPPGAEKVDWEVELAIIIGKEASYLDSPSVATDHIAGYAVSNDLSERAYQVEHSGGQWSKGKCCPTFNPLGPALVPAREVPDAGDLRLWSRVNGAPRQDSTTADMIFDARYLVWHLSQYLVLSPGDVVNTGTPQGVAMSGRFPYLTVGDEVEIGIEGLGVQRQRLVRTVSSR